MGKVKVVIDSSGRSRILVSRDSSGNSKLCSTCCEQTLPDPNEKPATCNQCITVQPIELKVTISGLVDVDPDACTAMVQSGRAGKFPNGIADLANDVFFVPHHPSVTCRYELTIPIDYDFDYWNSGCPVGAPISGHCDILRIRVTQNPSASLLLQVNIVDTTPGVGAIVMFSTQTGICFDSNADFDTDANTGPCLGTGTAVIEI